MIKLDDNILEEIHLHASREAPREACGVVVVHKGKHAFRPCRNISENITDFIINPEDWAEAEDFGTIILVVHSHVNINPQPSQADLVGCENSGLPWLIVNWPNKTTHYFEPSGYKATLVGRVFSQGILDCFTVIQDYYKDGLNIILPNPSFRTEKWWEKGEDNYVNNAPLWGFTRVDKPQLHDVILMRIGASVSNHAVIWLGNGTILHHQFGRLSSIDVYGGWYKKISTHIFRHKDVLI